MSNEQYLIVSYFAAGALSLGIAVAAYLWLRRSFCEIADDVPNRGLGGMLRRLFFPGIALGTLVGFFSVSFKSCEKDTYAKIIAERSYLVGKNQEQASSSLWYAVIALMVWGLILVVPLIVIKRSKAKGELRRER